MVCHWLAEHVSVSRSEADCTFVALQGLSRWRVLRFLTISRYPADVLPLPSTDTV